MLLQPSRVWWGKFSVNYYANASHFLNPVCLLSISQELNLHSFCGSTNLGLWRNKHEDDWGPSFCRHTEHGIICAQVDVAERRHFHYYWRFGEKERAQLVCAIEPFSHKVWAHPRATDVWGLRGSRLFGYEKSIVFSSLFCRTSRKINALLCGNHSTDAKWRLSELIQTILEEL